MSGSGKSTLAFDTLYAEGQRRYVESLSTYARQFLGAHGQTGRGSDRGAFPGHCHRAKDRQPQSPVHRGHVTEIYDYMRLLFARAGTPHCHQCGRPISSQSVDQIVDSILGLEPGSRIIIMAPLVRHQKGAWEKLFKRLKKRRIRPGSGWMGRFWP